MDVEGYIWNARWDGSCLLRLTPDGAVDRILELPISRPTSCVFGGPNLTTLYITSAASPLITRWTARYWPSRSMCQASPVTASPAKRCTAAPCRSELAREKPESAACIQAIRVIVNVFREQARSYKKQQQ
jgi:hypothetical protein